jgi:hypothetical protein
MNMKTLSRTVLALTLAGFAANAKTMNSETEKAAMNLGAHASSQIQFEKGKADLKPEELNQLKEVVNQVKASGQKIDEIKIISWADREYPAEGTTAPNQQVKLAEQRADKIKDFLKKELKVGDVDVYNMAKRPNSLQEIFNTETAKVKDSMQNAGAAPTNKEDTGWFGLKGKTSEALVLVYTDKK